MSHVESKQHEQGKDQPGDVELPVAGSDLRPVRPDPIAQEIEDGADDDYLRGKPEVFLKLRADGPSWEKWPDGSLAAAEKYILIWSDYAPTLPLAV
jgi:hypothetical protein